MEAAIPILLGISAAAGVASGVAAFSQPKAPAAPSQSQTSMEQAQASEAAAMAQATTLMKRRGMASTILTSPLGVSGTQTQRSTLGA